VPPPGEGDLTQNQQIELASKDFGTVSVRRKPQSTIASMPSRVQPFGDVGEVASILGSYFMYLVVDPSVILELFGLGVMLYTASKGSPKLLFLILFLSIVILLLDVFVTSKWSEPESKQLKKMLISTRSVFRSMNLTAVVVSLLAIIFILARDGMDSSQAEDTATFVSQLMAICEGAGDVVGFGVTPVLDICGLDSCLGGDDMVDKLPGRVQAALAAVVTCIGAYVLIHSDEYDQEETNTKLAKYLFIPIGCVFILFAAYWTTSNPQAEGRVLNRYFKK